MPVSRGLIQAFFGCVAVYGALMATGSALYGNHGTAMALGGMAATATLGVLWIHRQRA